MTKCQTISIKWWVAFLSAFIGSFSHVLLDSIMHTDVEPFYPITLINNCHGFVSIEVLRNFCVYSGLAGAVIYYLIFWRMQQDLTTPPFLKGHLRAFYRELAFCRNNMKKINLLCIVLAIFFVSLGYAADPDRAKGISVHALPKRVAKISGKPWGLQVSYAPYLKPELGQPFLQSISDVLEYIKKQNLSVIKNGLWVVTTNPMAYSEEELEFQEQIKTVLPIENIPLFWVRGAELDKGFTRY